MVCILNSDIYFPHIDEPDFLFEETSLFYLLQEENIASNISILEMDEKLQTKEIFLFREACLWSARIDLIYSLDQLQGGAHISYASFCLGRYSDIVYKKSSENLVQMTATSTKSFDSWEFQDIQYDFEWKPFVIAAIEFSRRAVIQILAKVPQLAKHIEIDEIKDQLKIRQQCEQNLIKTLNF